MIKNRANFDTAHRDINTNYRQALTIHHRDAIIAGLTCRSAIVAAFKIPELQARPARRPHVNK